MKGWLFLHSPSALHQLTAGVQSGAKREEAIVKTSLGIVAALIAVSIAPAAAEERGITATEIKLGQTMPYSGPVSAFSPLGKGEVGYFKMINDNGGVNGRKINFISLDDGYVPPKTVELVRQLVEREQVLLMFAPLGTAPNIAIQKYLNQK